MSAAFRDLWAYQRAFQFTKELHAEVRRWSAFDQRTIGTQLVRAAGSVGANIAEGRGRWHPRDRRRFYLTARASLYEVEHWLLLAEAAGLLPAGVSQRCDKIAAPLNGLIKRPA